MNLEKQVCSLGFAKKLKGLGVKQESLFYYNGFNDGYQLLNIFEDPSKDKKDISAFTVAELGGNVTKNI